jgi:hypothetical protein
MFTEGYVAKRQRTEQHSNDAFNHEFIFSSNSPDPPTFASSETPNTTLLSGYANPIINFFSLLNTRHNKRKREDPPSHNSLSCFSTKPLINSRKRPFEEGETTDSSERTESDTLQKKRLKSKSQLFPYTDWLYWRMSRSGSLDE